MQAHGYRRPVVLAFRSWLGAVGAIAVLVPAAASPSHPPALAGPPRLTVATEAVRPYVVVAPEAASRPFVTDASPVLAVLGPGRYLVYGQAQELARRLPGTELLPWPPERAAAALEPLLDLAGDPRAVKGASSSIRLIVAMVPGADLRAAAARLARRGAAVAWQAPEAMPPQVGLQVSGAAMTRVRDALLGLDGLVWVDLQAPVRLRNAASAWACQSGIVGSTPFFADGLVGAGQVVGIMDTGLDADHCFFYDPARGLPPLNDDTGTMVDLEQRKVLAVDLWWDPLDLGPTRWDDHGHGTHVAGSVAGDQPPYLEHTGNDGMAPGARLVIQDGGAALNDCADLPGLGCPVRPLGPMLAQAYAQGARIHSDSWGDEENIPPPNRYTERTADIDRFCWQHQDMLVLVAAGNAGGLDTVGSPATGKNVVAVGATRHGSITPACVAGLSSRGWTQDGRIKPDLVVPGDSVLSASSDGIVTSFNCGIRPGTGTSMATPTAAGMAALVRQYFEDGYAPDGLPDPARGVEPSAALVKAVLIASAVDLASDGCAVDPIPSRDQGWGMIRLDHGLPLPGSELRLEVVDEPVGLASAASEPVSLQLRTVASGGLKVVLVWTDPPSTSLAQRNLVNDLDLELAGPEGTYRGNVLVQGVSVTGGEADRLNNVEVVWLPEAPAGDWTVTVAPAAVELGPQSFALVAVGRLAARAPRLPAGRRAF